MTMTMITNVNEAKAAITDWFALQIAAETQFGLRQIADGIDARSFIESLVHCTDLLDVETFGPCPRAEYLEMLSEVAIGMYDDTPPVF